MLFSILSNFSNFEVNQRRVNYFTETRQSVGAANNYLHFLRSWTNRIQKAPAVAAGYSHVTPEDCVHEYSAHK